MKTINETFEVVENEKVIEKKACRSWRQFILDMAKVKKGGD